MQQESETPRKGMIGVLNRLVRYIFLPPDLTKDISKKRRTLQILFTSLFTLSLLACGESAEEPSTYDITKNEIPIDGSLYDYYILHGDRYSIPQILNDSENQDSTNEILFLPKPTSTPITDYSGEPDIITAKLLTNLPNPNNLPGSDKIYNMSKVYKDLLKIAEKTLSAKKFQEVLTYIRRTFRNTNGSINMTKAARFIYEYLSKLNSAFPIATSPDTICLRIQLTQDTSPGATIFSLVYNCPVSIKQ